MYLPDAFVHALGWTLAHSLWQGSLFALLLWVILPRFQSAAARYQAALASLLAMLVTATVTFSIIYEPGKTLSPEQTPLPANFLTDPSTVFLWETALPERSPWQALSAWFEAHHLFLVSAWLLGFGFFLLRLLGGLYAIRQMRTQQTSPVSEEWAAHFEFLVEKSGLRCSVQLLESGLARTPMVIGFLKPLVLLPVGALNQLSADETEAILVHELAHIARRDWVVNLFQAFVEALFYYHPAVWWMSNVVRTEREHACDDFAVALTGNPLLYAKALLRVQEISQPSPLPALALAFDGPRPFWRKPSPLLERIKRILHQPPSKSPLMEKFAATGILLVLIALWGARAESAPAVFSTLKSVVEAPVEWVTDFVGEQTPENTETDETSPLEYATESDSIPKSKRTHHFISDDGNSKVEMSLENGTLKTLAINGKEIAPADFPKYEALTDSLLADVMPPIPPMAPMAPMAPMSPMEPMPPFPALAPTSPLAPFPPGAPAIGYAPSFQNSRSRIRADQDEKGNTVIVIEQNGTPREVVVKDGVVYLDGKKVEKGQSLELGEGSEDFQFHWDGTNGGFFQSGDDKFVFPAPEKMELERFRAMADEDFLQQNQELQEAAEELKRASEDFQRDAEQRYRELAADFAQQQEELKKASKERRAEIEQEMAQSRQEMQEDLEQRREELRQMEEELRSTHRETMENARIAQLEALEEARAAQRADREARRTAVRNNGVPFSDLLKVELINSGIIKDPRNFSISLTAKSLKVDGKKQSEEVLQKILQLHRSVTGNEFGKNDKVTIEESN